MGYFSSSKAERDRKSTTSEQPGRKQEATPAAPPSPTPSETISTLGRGLLLTGNIVCTGSVHIHGRVLGDIYASHLVIFEGAQVEGEVVAQEALINGTFKGTIHGNNVELQSKAVVDGEIFNRSLSIAKDAQFEGVARRLDKPVEAPPCPQVKGEKAALAAPAEVVPLSGVARSPTPTRTP